MRAFTIHLNDEEAAILSALAARCVDLAPEALLAESAVRILKSLTSDFHTRTLVLAESLLRTMDEKDAGVRP